MADRRALAPKDLTGLNMMIPATEDELAEAIAATTEPLRIAGGGTRPLGNPTSGKTLSVAGLTGIHLYEPGALTLVAAAGTPVVEIEAALAAENQRLAFEPMDHRGLLGSAGHSTIGGIAAANISGPRRVQSGACRDFMLGVRFVDGAGNVLKNGGRVMKNVTGYDLVKLLAGSFGTLGVISEVSLKVLPKAETEATLLLDGLTDESAVKALSRSLASPFDVTGAAHVTGGKTMIRLEGFADAVAYRGDALRSRLAEFGDVAMLSADASAKAWQAQRDVAAFHGQKGDVWRLSVKPSDGPQIGARLQQAGAQTLYDWGGGLVWALLPEGTDARAALAGYAGHARLERANDEVKKRLGCFGSQGPAIDRLAAGLRQRFDPRGILNSGLMG